MLDVEIRHPVSEIPVVPLQSLFLNSACPSRSCVLQYHQRVIVVEKLEDELIFGVDTL